MFKRAASGSGCDRQFVFGNHRPMNRAVRPNAHFLRADQAAFHHDAVRDHRIADALHAAANSRARTNAQLASDHDVADDDLAGLNLEVAVMQKTMRHCRVWEIRTAAMVPLEELATPPISIRGAFSRKKLQPARRRMRESEEMRP